MPVASLQRIVNTATKHNAPLERGPPCGGGGVLSAEEMEATEKVKSRWTRSFFTGLNTRNEEERDVCDICHKDFASPSNLFLHRSTHAIERRYKCEPCQVSFHSQGHLQKHKRSSAHETRVEMTQAFGIPTSDNPRPYGCPECNTAFRKHGHLAKHLRSKSHITKLEANELVPAGTYAALEKGGQELKEKLVTTNCEQSLQSLRQIAMELFQLSPGELPVSAPIHHRSKPTSPPAAKAHRQPIVDLSQGRSLADESSHGMPLMSMMSPLQYQTQSLDYTLPSAAHAPAPAQPVGPIGAHLPSMSMIEPLAGAHLLPHNQSLPSAGPFKVDYSPSSSSATPVSLHQRESPLGSYAAAASTAQHAVALGSHSPTDGANQLLISQAQQQQHQVPLDISQQAASTTTFPPAHSQHSTIQQQHHFHSQHLEQTQYTPPVSMAPYHQVEGFQQQQQHEQQQQQQQQQLQPYALQAFKMLPMPPSMQRYNDQPEDNNAP